MTALGPSQRQLLSAFAFACVVGMFVAGLLSSRVSFGMASVVVLVWAITSPLLVYLFSLHLTERWSGGRNALFLLGWMGIHIGVVAIGWLVGAILAGGMAGAGP